MYALLPCMITMLVLDHNRVLEADPLIGQLVQEKKKKKMSS